MRSILIRTQPAEHVLVLTLHHVVTDNWPQTVLYRELGALYAAFSRGATSPLAELPLQYGDYAVWQRRWIQGEVLESRLSYWRKQFADWTRLVLPTDHPPVEASTIQRMLSQWRSLLERVVVSPDEPITSFALASAETSSSLPDPSVHLPELPMEPAPRVFESWAERQPERTALRQGNRRYSYGELHQGATTLARRLVAGRSTRGEVVAVTGPRSFGFIESALGVLLSGRVLVTLDRRLPAERQRLMLREAAAARIVYVGEPRPEDQWIWELSLPATEVPRHGGAADDKSVPQADLPALQGDDEAYVFFTSGTTGVPKGVLGCHKGLSHFLKWQREAFGVGPDDRCSHLTSVSFDVVLREIFLPLTSGVEPLATGFSSRLRPTRHNDAMLKLRLVFCRARSLPESYPPKPRMNRLRPVQTLQNGALFVFGGRRGRRGGERDSSLASRRGDRDRSYGSHARAGVAVS